MDRNYPAVNASATFRNVCIIDIRHMRITTGTEQTIKRDISFVPDDVFFPYGDELYFVSEKSGQEFDSTFRNAYSEYTKMLSDVDWLLSLQFKNLGNNTLFVRTVPSFKKSKTGQKD